MNEGIAEILTNYCNTLIDEARKRLLTAEINRSKKFGGSAMTVPRTLAQSIVFNVFEKGEGFEAIIKLPYFAEFINTGVVGNTGNIKEGAEGSPYSYKNKIPPPPAFQDFTGATGWISQHGIDVGQAEKKGKLDKIKRNKQLAFLIARGIQQKGLPGYHFLDFIFEKQTGEKLTEMLVEKIKDNVTVDVLKTFKEELK